MIEDYHLNDLASVEDIDTSEIATFDNIEDDDSDFYDSFTAADFLNPDDLDRFDGICIENNPFEEVIEQASALEHTTPIRNSQISFGLGCHCMVHGCGCRSFEGKFGCVCTNCHHGYDKHY